MFLRYLVALICVIGIAAGQILFKLSANGIKTDGLLSAKALVPLIGAFALYGTTSLGWVWVLKDLSLNRVYPFMGAAFVVVPIASWLMFGDRLNVQYLVGSLLIATGIVVTVSAVGSGG